MKSQNKVERDLIEIARTISEHYESKVVIVGHIGMLLQYAESFRHTKDIDLHIDSADIYNEIENVLEQLIPDLKVIDMKDNSTHSKRLKVNLRGSIYKIDIDNKNEPYVVVRPYMIYIQETNSRLADKLSVAFSHNVYRRLKDVFDILYISEREYINTKEIEIALNKKGKDIIMWSYLPLLDITKMKQAFSKFVGQEMYSDFDTFFKDYTKLLLPLLSNMKEGKDETWSPDKMTWM